MKKIISIVVVLVIILILIGLYGAGEEKVETTVAPIKIGAIISETGIAAAFGEMSRKGIDLAVKEINEAGGVEGRNVEVVFEDDQTDPKVSSGLFQKLTGIDKVSAIIGSNFDFVTQPLFSLAATNKVVVISPSNPRIPGAFDTNSHSFVMMTEFSDIIRAFGDYFKTAEYTQLGILRFESAFAEEIQNTLNTMQVEMGKKPIVAETYKQIGNNDFKTQILKLKQAKVDLVFLDMIGPDPVTFVNQASQLKYFPKIITHIGIQDALAMKEVDPKMFDGAVLINWNFSPAPFITKFETAYGMKPDKSANRAYDAVYVLTQAIPKVKEGTDLARVLESETFVTPNEQFKFNANHSAVSTPVLIQTIKEGQLVEWEGK
ncbi:MAG: ABC transporter substrate-binding protein [Patescibacteria group bacterium]